MVGLRYRAARRFRSTCLALSRHSPVLRDILSRGLTMARGHALLPLAPMSGAEPDISALLQAGKKTITTAPKKLGSVAKTVNVDLPEIHFRGFRDAVVTADSSGMIKDGHLVLPDDLYAHRHRVIGINHLCPNYDDQTAFVRSHNPVPIAKGIFMAGLGSFNWYHWLVEILPKATLFECLPTEMREYPLLVPPEFAKYPTYRQALKTLGLTNEVIVLQPRQAYRLDHVIFIDSHSMTPFNMRAGFWPKLADNACNAEILLGFRNRILEALALPVRTRWRRIFLARSNTRRDYNQRELIEMLTGLGIETVYTDKLNFRTQVQLLRDAELVIGPSGAAWANLIFTQKGSKGVIWTFPEYAEVSCYSNLAATAGADLSYLFFPAKPPPSSTNDLYTASYDIDLAALREIVQQAIDALTPIDSAPTSP